MREVCHEDLVRIADAVEIHSPTSYSVSGDRRDLSAGLMPAVPLWSEPRVDDARSRTEAVLESELYFRLYSRPRAGRTPSDDPLPLRDHVAALSAANCGKKTWEPGWKVVAIGDDGRVGVMKDQVTFWVSPLDLCPAPSLGEYCRVRIGKEIRQLVPGYYLALGGGEPDGDPRPRRPAVRIYWNLTAPGAIRYMKLATERLNAAGFPFRTKVIADPRFYRRADAGVLYLEWESLPVAQPMIFEIHAALCGDLHDEIPMFTKRLARGLAAAEDPGDGLSFGQSRCRIAARGLLSMCAHGRADAARRLVALLSAFHQAGLDAARPYLGNAAWDRNGS